MLSLPRCRPQHKPSPGTSITLVFLGVQDKPNTQQALLDEIRRSVYSTSIGDRVLVTKRNCKGEAEI